MAFGVRGALKNPTLAAQPVDFGALRYGPGYIAGTDIDFLFERGGKVFLIGELKYKDTPLSAGQRIAMENLAKAIDDPDKDQHAAVVVLSHEVPPGQIIDITKAQTKMAFYRNSRKPEVLAWYKARHPDIRHALSVLQNRCKSIPPIDFEE